MIKHLTITKPGTSLSITGERLIVKEGDSVSREIPLSRLKSIRLFEKGIGLSSNLIGQCARRGIPLFFSDFSGRSVAFLSGNHQHGVVELRKRQLAFVEANEAYSLAKRILYGKVRNQRAVLLYFLKYQKKLKTEIPDAVQRSMQSLESTAQSLKCFESRNQWRDSLMGLEGSAAAVYWKTLKSNLFFGPEFPGREGRGAGDSINQALNLGYAILTSYVWNAVSLAGLEPYAGTFHTDRPGKPSLVLDIMEEYRPWVVDRNVIRLRNHLMPADGISPSAKHAVIEAIHETFDTEYPYRGKRMKLETILQRQVYRLCGFLYGKKHYQPLLFRW